MKNFFSELPGTPIDPNDLRAGDVALMIDDSWNGLMRYEIMEIESVHGSRLGLCGGADRYTDASNRTWRLLERPKPPVKPGIYVAKVWAEQPESSIAWKLRGNDAWIAMTPQTAESPRGFYGANWRDHIVRLVAAIEA